MGRYFTLLTTCLVSLLIGDARRLVDYRHRIDRIDDELYGLLAKRMALSEKIGQLKKGSRSVADVSREADIIGRLSARTGLTPGFVGVLWGDIFTESRRVQDAVVGAES